MTVETCTSRRSGIIDLPVARGLPLLVAACLLLVACNTTPERPPPAPEPIPDSTDLPEPPPLSPIQPESPLIDQSSARPPTAPAAASSYPAPSSNAADVEVEEVPVGTPTTSATRPTSEVLAEMGDRTAATGGGGANVPAGGDHGDGTESSGATGQAMSTTTGAGMTTPNFQIDPPAGPAQRDALAARLATFDEHLRRARAAAEDEYAAAGNRGDARGRLDGQGQRTDDAVDGAGGAAATGSGLGNTPDLSGTDSGAVQPSPLMAGTPPDLSDASNDDIVARQLREAASKEPDPVLRDKLWAEYRKYKANL